MRFAPWFWKAWPPGTWEAWAWCAAFYPAFRTSAFGRPWEDTQ